MFTAGEPLDREPRHRCLFCEGHSLKVCPLLPQAKHFTEKKDMKYVKKYFQYSGHRTSCSISQI